MVRRTRAEAEQTRLAILDAARRTFLERGVTHTTIGDIAQAAGVTRGAVYWHFSNKLELFLALRNSVTLPLLDKGYEKLQLTGSDPLAGIESLLHGLACQVVNDPHTRDTYAVIHCRCEFTDELRPLLDEINLTAEQFTRTLEAVYRKAARMGQLRTDVRPVIAALETYAFITGLVRSLVTGMRTKDLHRHTRRLIEAHIAQKRA